MKTFHTSYTSLISCSIFILFTACDQNGHKQAQRKIQEERAKEAKATADISDAIRATDTIGWDAVAVYNSFRDSCQLRLQANNEALKKLELAEKENGRKKIRPGYKRNIRNLAQRNIALEQRLKHYSLTGGQEAWQDFSRLYRFDLARLEKDIQKLTKK